MNLEKRRHTEANHVSFSRENRSDIDIVQLRKQTVIGIFEFLNEKFNITFDTKERLTALARFGLKVRELADKKIKEYIDTAENQQVITLKEILDDLLDEKNINSEFGEYISQQYALAVSKDYLSLQEKTITQMTLGRQLIKEQVCTEEEFVEFISQYSNEIRAMIFTLKQQQPVLSPAEIDQQLFDYAKNIIQSDQKKTDIAA